MVLRRLPVDAAAHGQVRGREESLHRLLRARVGDAHDELGPDAARPPVDGRVGGLRPRQAQPRPAGLRRDARHARRADLGPGQLVERLLAGGTPGRAVPLEGATRAAPRAGPALGARRLDGRDGARADRADPRTERLAPRLASRPRRAGRAQRGLRVGSAHADLSAGSARPVAGERRDEGTLRLLRAAAGTPLGLAGLRLRSPVLDRASPRRTRRALRAAVPRRRSPTADVGRAPRASRRTSRSTVRKSTVRSTAC